MKVIDLIESLENWVKPHLIDTWDNTGFQIGDLNQDVEKVLIALDVDRKVLDRAIDGNYDMIISHHPLIFKDIKNIRKEDYKGDLILDIIKNNIAIYNAHSNLDLAKGGVNDVLANKLGMRDLKDLNIVFKDEEYDYGYGRVGNIKKTSVKKFLDHIKKALKIDYLLFYGDIEGEIDRIAVCGGSGSDFILDAYNHGAQMYISGDIKYHEAQLANELGMLIVDPGHFDSEKIVLPTIKKYLTEKLKSDIEIEIVEEASLPRIVY